MTYASLPGESVGAFFDVDGTLLPAPSLEWRFIGYLLERQEISCGHLGRWLARFARACWHDLHGATLGNKLYLHGLNEALVIGWERSLAPALKSLAFFDQALQRIAWHSAQGHRVFLVTGTLAPLAQVVARELGAVISAEIEVCATELEIAPGTLRIWSGRIAGEHRSDGAKLRAVRMLAARYGLDLARSYAYGDSAGDQQLLEAVGCAVAVNPTERLARVARKRGWETYGWEKAVGAMPIVAAQRLTSKAAR